MMGASSRGLNARLWGASAAALLCLSLGFAADPAAADKVGVAAAVNPDAFSSLSGAPQSQLSIGKSIFFNERINTTTSGLVQVLLVDGSTFTVGPGSDLVIDKFVYDPKKGTGQIAASMSKGVMRFVGGKISKNEDAVKVNTPAGALAIRGGMFQMKVNGSALVASFLYGKQLTLGKYTVYEPGYTIDTTGGTPTVRPTTTADINAIMASLTNGSAGGLGSTAGDQNPPSNPDTQGATNTETEIVDDATQTQIQTTVQEQQQQQQQQQEQPGPPPPPPPTPITLRVVTAPSSYTAYDQSIADPLHHGILGGDDNPYVTVDDFETTLLLQNGRLKGTIDGLRDGCFGESCAEDGTKPNSPATVNLPWTFSADQCDAGVCLVTDATIKQGTVTTSYVGAAVQVPGFFAYHLAAYDHTNPQDVQLSDHVLLFGGDTYQFTQPSGTVYTFDLVPDVIQGGSAPPFASLESTPPSGVKAAITPLVMLDDGAHTVWLQTSFSLERNEDGTLATGSQDSFINIALGGKSEDGGLVGMRRGGSQLDIIQQQGCEPECGPTINRQSLAFTGDIATLAGPDGSHFMGTENPNMVIGFDSTGTNHNIGRDIPLDPIAGYNDTVENQSGSTYHIGVGTGTLPVGTQTDATFKGYAAGFAQQAGGGTPRTLVNISPDDVTVSLAAATNTMTATLNLGDGILQNPKYKLEFGGAGRSAFIDGNLFAAVEAASGSSVTEQYWGTTRGPFGIQLPVLKTHVDNNPNVQSYIASADAINANAVLFDTNAETQAPNKTAFCNQCAFLKWGAWGTRVTSKDHNEIETTKDVQLGWWITGDVVAKNDMPITGSATYAGDAIGTVSANGQQYAATGDLGMTWDFGKRSGLLQISDFDGKDFGGIMLAPGRAQFAGALVGAGGLVGAANGSFVGSPGRGLTPNGVIGNFGVGNSSWQATGIFGGTAVPH